tara:strand:+ start:61 stop:516 length:456 start_codon:yes stop_codon:yes gene_type:complete
MESNVDVNSLASDIDALESANKLSEGSVSEILDDSNIDLKTFKDTVKNYITVDNKISKLQEAVKTLKKEKTNLSSNILDFMSNHDIEDLNTNNGKIKRTVNYVKKPLNKQVLQSKLSEFFNDDTKAGKLLELLNSREKVQKVRLTHVHKSN